MPVESACPRVRGRPHEPRPISPRRANEPGPTGYESTVTAVTLNSPNLSPASRGRLCQPPLKPRTGTGGSTGTGGGTVMTYVTICAKK